MVTARRGYQSAVFGRRPTGGWTLYGSAIFTRSTGFRPLAGDANPFGSAGACTVGVAAELLGGARDMELGLPIVG